MPQLLTLSRAARLASVSRGQMQAQMRAQDLEAFEGKIAVEYLLRLYPTFDIEYDPI